MPSSTTAMVDSHALLDVQVRERIDARRGCGRGASEPRVHVDHG